MTGRCIVSFSDNTDYSEKPIIFRNIDEFIIWSRNRLGNMYTWGNKYGYRFYVNGKRACYTYDDEGYINGWEYYDGSGNDLEGLEFILSFNADNDDIEGIINLIKLITGINLYVEQIGEEIKDEIREAYSIRVNAPGNKIEYYYIEIERICDDCYEVYLYKYIDDKLIKDVEDLLNDQNGDD